MTDNSTEFKNLLDKVASIVEKLEAEFERENWENVERLIKDRNQAVSDTFTEDLPADLHSYAKRLFDQVRNQDQRLLENAKELKKQSQEELMKLNKAKQSINAYQQQ
ncbi:hypothetical protein KOI40_15145 [Aestuariicella sp. G3-2]|uniref:hypothetical protein n=1 Tax=Pseudomaricurvus albidus TaxID=2842452 RepID=UPI001C0E1B52|nr:hypothetical protein [Aestuariicella albida]MBU3071159.1 hypothetical protein [Aestuariicella albida]